LTGSTFTTQLYEKLPTWIVILP